MGNLTDLPNPIVEAIYATHKQAGDAELSRGYLGASAIGQECSRALWYSFRWAGKPEFSGRMFRLFQTGHMAEHRFNAEMRAIGATVHEVDPATGKQFGFSGHGGHARGHMDGCAIDIPTGGAKWHVLEYKTHGSKSFAKLKDHGVKKSKPEHYAQVVWYMGKSGMDRALYLACNKDTDELYAERIEFDPLEFARIEARFDSIIFSPEPPPKLSEDPKFYLCGWCAHNAVCHGNRVPPPSCRTCCHSTPESDGDARWSCAKHGPEIPVQTQRTGCGNHLPLPFLLTYAYPVDAGDGWIMFERKDNKAQFIVKDDATPLPGPLPLERFIYSSQEISAAKDHRIICDPMVEEMKTQYPNARIVG